MNIPKPSKPHKDFLRALRAPDPAPAEFADKILERTPHGAPGRKRALYTKTALAAAGLLFLLFSLPRRPRDTVQEPKVTHFSADKADVRLGEAITLRWDVVGGDRVLIDDGQGFRREVRHLKSLTVVPPRPGRYTFSITLIR